MHLLMPAFNGPKTTIIIKGGKTMKIGVKGQKALKKYTIENDGKDRFYKAIGTQCWEQIRKVFQFSRVQCYV